MSQPADVVRFPGEEVPRPDRPFELGDWRVEPRANRVLHRGRTYKLEPRVMQTLVVLARHAPEPVTRDELMLAVWGHHHITDDALNRAVSRLRRVLRNGPETSIEIETIPKVGYRLIPPPGVDAPRPLPMAGRWRRPGLAVVIGVVAGLLAAAGYSFLGSDEGLRLEPSPRSTRPLTTLPGREIMPDFSPDGSQVVFAWQGPTQADWDLFVRPLDSEALLRLTESPMKDIAPAWSPDGSRIAFLRTDDRSCLVLSISPVGGPERRLADCDPDADPVLAWTPDGEHLVFTPRQDNRAKGLALLDLDAETYTGLTSPADDEIGDSQAAVSPDGARIAFTRWHTYGVGNIFTVPVGGGELRQVSFDDMKVHGIAWEPDSRHLVFSSNRAGPFGLWRVDVEDGDLSRLQVPARAPDSPTLSADGERLVFEDWDERTSIYRLAADPALEPEALVASTRWDWSPALSPDERLLAFVSDRSGALELWFSDADGENPVRLTEFGGPYLGNPRFSPNGRYIAFDVAAEGQFDVWVADIVGGAPIRVTADPAQDRMPSWSADGRYLYFGSDRADGWQVWRMRLSDQRVERITADGGHRAMEAGDGYLYFSHCDTEASLWRVPVAGGDPALVTERLQPYHCANWSAGGDAIHMARRESDGSTWIERLDPATGDSRALRRLPDYLGKSGFAVSTDGDILYARSEQSESDLIYVER